MSKIKLFILLIWTNFRLIPVTIRNNDIKLSKKLFFHPRSEINFCKDSKISIGDGFRFGRGSTLTACSGSHLIIGKNSSVNRNSSIICKNCIEIGDSVAIGPNCCIYDHDHDLHNRSEYISSKITIKSGAWIGAGCIILKGVTIGENSVVAAGSVVTKDIADNTILYQKREDFYRMI